MLISRQPRQVQEPRRMCRRLADELRQIPPDGFDASDDVREIRCGNPAVTSTNAVNPEGCHDGKGTMGPVSSQIARRGRPVDATAGSHSPGKRACQRLYRHWPGGVRVRGPRIWCLRRFRRVLADGGQMRGPAPCACPCVPAVPTEVGASAAAIGHHLASGQSNTT